MLMLSLLSTLWLQGEVVVGIQVTLTLVVVEVVEVDTLLLLMRLLLQL